MATYRDPLNPPLERVIEKVRDHLNPWMMTFIRRSPFLVMASSDENGWCDASPRGGEAGFVTILNDRQLIIPDAPGNNLFQSYGNVLSNARVGLVFFIPGIVETARVNGRATILDSVECGPPARGDLAVTLHESLGRGLLVDIEESYYHCGRALKSARLWDIDTIIANREERPLPKRPGEC
jgi:uncharacterized protein